MEPARTENGYRDYSDEDLETLKKIMLLRALQVSLKDIRALQRGEDALGEVMQRRIDAMTQQRGELDRALRVCRELREARLDWRDLPAQQYMEHFDRTLRDSVAQKDRIPGVQAPLRRFFARELDLLCCSAAWGAFLALVCGVGVRSGGWLLWASNVAVPLMLMLLFEPLLLHLSGTTPGKWVLGLRVTDPEGGLLSFSDALSRTGRVIVSGMGLEIFPFSLIRRWKSCRTCDEGKELPWEKNSMLSLRDEKPFRAAAYVFLGAAILGLLFFFVAEAGMPRHMGELTVAQFGDNFNRLARFYGFDFSYGGFKAVLDENGLWTKKNGEGTAYLPDTAIGDSVPTLVFREDGRGVSEVSFALGSSPRSV